MSTKKELLDYMYGLAQNVADYVERNGYECESLNIRVCPKYYKSGGDMIRVNCVLNDGCEEKTSHALKNEAEYISYTIDKDGRWHLI